MKNRYVKLAKMYNVIYISALVIAAQLLLKAYTAVNYNCTLLIVTGVLISGLLEYVSYKDSEIKRIVRVIMTVVLMALLSVLFLRIYRECTDGINGIKNSVIFEDVLLRHVNFLTIISSLFVCMIYRLLHNFKYSRGLIPFVLIVILIVSRIMEVTISLEAVILILYVFIVNAGSVRGGEYYIYFTPYVLAFCIMLYIIPTRDEPLSWESVTGIWESVNDNLTDRWYDFKNFVGIGDMNDTVFTGYSESDIIAINDNIEGDDTVQLRLDGTPHRANIYIIGSYYNEYDGKTWKKNYSDKNYPEYEISLFENLNRAMAAIKSNGRYADRISVKNMRITYRGSRKSTLFAPYNMIHTDSDWKYSYNNSSLMFDDARREDDYYNVWYVDIDNKMNNRLLYQCSCDMEKVDIGDVINYLDYSMNYNLIRYMDYKTLNDIKNCLEHREKYVRDNYCDMSFDAHKRVRELAKDITKNCDTQYDKAKAIEEYLADNYTYSTQVESASFEECNVETFLFDTKKGSCLHFATAFAVLARYVDIPSRVVTGFCASYDNTQADRAYVLVRGSNGHAWPEVYLGVAGWFRFEPAAAYNAGAYLEDYGAAMPTLRPAASEIPVKGAAKGKGSKSTVPEDTGHPEEDRDDDNRHISISVEHIMIIFGAFIAAVILIMLVVFTGYIKLNRIRYSNNAGNNKCSRNISDIIRLYKKHCKKTPGCICIRNNTLNETADIMSEWLGGEADNYRHIINEYQACIFGNKKIRTSIVKESEDLLSRLKKSK